MKKINFNILLLTLFCIGIISAIADGRYESKKETVKYEKVNELKVSNVTGGITVTGWDKDYVEITYTKKARNEDDLDDIDVDITQRGDALYIVTDLPWRCKQCGVEYDIFLPEKFKSLEAETVTGSVNIAKMEFVDDFAVKSTTGSINAELSARLINANVVTGGITLRLKDVAEKGEIKAEAVTGSIKIYAPENLQADLDCSAVTGSVDIDDYTLDRVRVKKKNKLKATIGEGNIPCRLSTVTGSISLKMN